ncbi:DUF222 domain-containing protein [Mycolicibacterium sp. XJ2546]
MLIEQLFEYPSADVLIAEIESTHREESMLMARRMASIGDLLSVRTEEAEGADPDPGYAVITGFARTCAEVGAAMNMAPMAASRLVSQAEALDTRLPMIAELLEDADIDWPTTQLIITRTELVEDYLIEQVDQRLAARLIEWSSWSRRRLINAVDKLVREIDPDAAKERRESAERRRYVSTTARPDGTADLNGRISATAAAAFEQRISQLAMSVCAKDSRTMDQRRADAVLALSEGRGLPCDCGRPECPARGADGADNGPRTVINVIASEDTVTGEGEEPGYLEGFGVIDAAHVRELADTAAAVRLIEPPTVTEEEATRYQPSAEVARWVRLRDLTCRFPGCDRPAARCDTDHTTPFNHANPTVGGLTVPSGLADYCRQHHRLKTFHGGPGGWKDEQLADGTIVWTSPTGRTYRTTPGGAELFPQMRPACAAPTARKASRARDKAARIKRIRNKLREERPINAAIRYRDRARRQEIELRKWRNRSRKYLLLFKGGKPSTSPWCPWINEPMEPEELPPDWEPPPKPPSLPDDADPPF